MTFRYYISAFQMDCSDGWRWRTPLSISTGRNAPSLHASDLDKVRPAQNAERRRRQATTDLQRAEIGGEEARLLDQGANLGLGVGIVTRIKEHALTARHRRVGQKGTRQMVEGLDDPGARHQVADELARVAVAQIDGLDAIDAQRVARVLRFRGVRIDELDGVGGVDDDAVVPGGQRTEDLLQIDPTNRDEDDIGLCRFCRGNGLDGRAEFFDQTGEGRRAAAVRNDGRNACLGEGPRHAGTERARADDTNAHTVLLCRLSRLWPPRPPPPHNGADNWYVCL